MASSVMDRPDEAQMRRMVKNTAGQAIEGLEKHLSNPKSKVVAVERHDRDWRDGQWETRKRFLWFKAREKTAVSQIRDNYCVNFRDKDLQVTLKVQQQDVDESTLLAELDYFNDQFIIFATQTSAESRAETYSPLQHPEPRQIPFKSIFERSHPDKQPILVTTRRIASPSFPLKKDSDNSDSLFIPTETEDVAELSMSDFLTEEQNSQMASGPDNSMAGSISAKVKAEQGDGPDFDFSGTADAEHRTSFGFHYAPRPLANPFDSTGSMDVDEDTTSPQTSLQKLLEEPLPEKLEAAVRKGITVLSELEEPLRTIPRDPDSRSWLAQIADVRKSATRNRTVIGVVGNTGAGKSSIINAILDEERLVPTNCMRACTAVVTEMSYNESKNETARYRAEVEFVQLEDWRRELELLHQEVIDPATKGISKEAKNADTVAGIAYAKIRAVYHKYTKDMLLKSTVDELMNVYGVNSILGTTKRINSSDCESFYQRLQHYVDSKQKFVTGQPGKKKTRYKRELEVWPLIKVVRIYTKSPALATGAVVVDLPGVHDSNAARAAVAESYMKECTGLWIVAPITRAVDDKAAKNLLGTTFKRQLKYDGTYSAVTFICSKTDDISRTEAIDSLQLGDRMRELENQRHRVSQQKHSVKHDRQQAKNHREHRDVEILHYDDQLDQWEELLGGLEDGEIASVPMTPGAKRKRTVGSDDANMFDDQPLTAQQLQGKIDETRMLKRIARQDHQKLRERLQILSEELNQLEAQEMQIDADEDAMCIKGRNEWSRGRIQEDFADGIRELDQENAAEQDPENFDPEQDIRNYKEVARSLPVFCVSSRTYQKLSGRLQKDSKVCGFSSTAQTEIPQLQEHCLKLTEKGRLAGCRRFLNSVHQILTSLTLWASDDGSDHLSTVQQRLALKSFLQANLCKLSKGIETAADQTMEDVVDTLRRQLVDSAFAAAAKTAADNAVDTADGWGAPLETGGLFWATYKATVRRNGVFHGASGSRNFNTELTDPLYKELATPWERAFHRRLPIVFNGFPRVTNAALAGFHKMIENKCKEQSLGLSRVARLRDSIPAYENAFVDIASTMVININEAQREVNREFTPFVSAAMKPAYTYCSNEGGRGSFHRMKQFMIDHVSTNQNAMFQNATAEVMSNLHKMCEQVKATMRGRAETVFDAISRDYMTIVGVEANKNRTIGKVEKTARKQVEDAIAQSELYFSEVLECDPALLDAAGSVEVTGGAESDGYEVEVEGEDASVPLADLANEDVLMDGEDYGESEGDDY
ncbi:hypothetical protein Q7P37_004683 [Cladosporium fusiforme]